MEPLKARRDHRTVLRESLRSTDKGRNEMAGSHREEANHPFTDPILTARLEAIKQLAGGLTDRVAVMDRNFNVIYANESACI